MTAAGDAPDVCDGTSAVGESRHRIPGASAGQPTEPCFNEQLGAALREPDEGSALVQHQPAALNRQIQTGLVSVRRALLAK